MKPKYMSRRVLISGGGTGGHIYPAISIANEFKKRNEEYKILFVGAKGRMEMKKVPKNGYKICLLYTSPSPRDKRQSRMPSSA